MSGELSTPDWRFAGIEHGFAPKDTTVAAHLRLIRVKQVHGADLIVADDDTPPEAGDADGLLTATPGTAIAIATADCVPVLFAAPRAGAVAAVHAGWRGSLAGIVPRAVERFASAFGVPAHELHVALGPSIGGCCYEIERDIADRFVDVFGQSHERAWRDGSPGKGTLDLRVVNRLLLEDSGVPPDAISAVGPCTACGDADFASYRRLGARAGRQLSWIGLAR